MQTRHKLALIVLGAIFAVLLVMLIITVIRGDDTNDRVNGAGRIHAVHAGPSSR